MHRWIRTFGPSRRVARINVDPNPALDLLEVKTVGEGEEITNLFHLDRTGATQLLDDLHDGLDVLEAAEARAAAAVKTG